MNASIGPLPTPSSVALVAVDADVALELSLPSTADVVWCGCERPACWPVDEVLVLRRSPTSAPGATSPPSSSVFCLDDAGELDLQPARQVELVLGLHDVRDAALAGLAVDPDDRLVGPADVLGVDRQVGHGPTSSSTDRPAASASRSSASKPFLIASWCEPEKAV